MSDICLDNIVEPSKEKSSLDKKSHLPYVGLEHLDSSVNEIKRWGSSSESISINNIFHYGDTLFGKLRPNLRKAVFAKFKGYCSTDILVLKPKENIDPLYASYICQSEIVFGFAERTAIGTGMPRTSWKDICKINVHCPTSLPIQRKIARILSTADAVIEKTQAAIAKYKAIKQGMLHDLFTRGIDPATNKLRPIYEDAPHLYKQSKLGWIPREWEVEKLEKICSMKSGDGITSLRIRNLDDYPVFGGNGLRGYTNSFTHDGEYTLIGRQGALCGNITRVSGKFYASEHAVVVTVETDIDVDWLSQKLETMKLNQYSEASAQPGLSVNKVMKLLVAKPLFEEQKKISNRLISIDSKLQTEQTYLYKLQQIKAGLMADLLSGKKSVIVDEEPSN